LPQQRELSCSDEHRCLRDHLLAKCSMSDHPSLEVRTRLWPETLNSSLIAGTIAEEDYKGNDWVVDGMKIRDNLLGRQGVALSPLVCCELPLLARVNDTFHM